VGEGNAAAETARQLLMRGSVIFGEAFRKREKGETGDEEEESVDKVGEEAAEPAVEEVKELQLAFMGGLEVGRLTVYLFNVFDMRCLPLLQSSYSIGERIAVCNCIS
jgi:hypothetical protein